MKLNSWSWIREVEFLKLNSWSWIREFVKLNSWSWIREVEFVKLNSWIWIREVEFVKLNSWSGILEVEFVKLNSWIREVEIVNSWSWNREFVKLKPWINVVEMSLLVFRRLSFLLRHYIFSLHSTKCHIHGKKKKNMKYHWAEWSSIPRLLRRQRLALQSRDITTAPLR